MQSWRESVSDSNKKFSHFKMPFTGFTYLKNKNTFCCCFFCKFLHWWSLLGFKKWSKCNTCSWPSQYEIGKINSWSYIWKVKMCWGISLSCRAGKIEAAVFWQVPLIWTARPPKAHFRKINKLAKLGDAIANSNLKLSMTHSITGVGARRCFGI